MVDAIAENRPQILETAEYFMADRGYDDGKLIRALWLDGEETKTLEGFDNIVYDYRGTVYCCCPRELKLKEMAYGGFEQQRDTLKYRCPARHYGRQCKGEKACPVKASIRLPLATDRRVFTPLARSSYRWKDQ